MQEKYNELKTTKPYNNEKVGGMSVLIEKMETELELWDYSLDEYKDILDIKEDGANMKKDGEAYIPLMWKSEEFMKHLWAITEWTINAEIENKSIKEIQVFRKEKNQSEKKLKEDNPFAEVGWQQHDGRNTYSTIRYKKSLKKKKKKI